VRDAFANTNTLGPLLHARATPGTLHTRDIELCVFPLPATPPCCSQVS
jgi:hypothetical protein